VRLEVQHNTRVAALGHELGDALRCGGESAIVSGERADNFRMEPLAMIARD